MALDALARSAPLAGQRVLAVPHLVDLILGSCDRPSLARCMRACTALFEPAARRVYAAVAIADTPAARRLFWPARPPPPFDLPFAARTMLRRFTRAVVFRADEALWSLPRSPVLAPSLEVDILVIVRAPAKDAFAGVPRPCRAMTAGDQFDLDACPVLGQLDCHLRIDGSLIERFFVLDPAMRSPDGPRSFLRDQTLVLPADSRLDRSLLLGVLGGPLLHPAAPLAVVLRPDTLPTAREQQATSVQPVMHFSLNRLATRIIAVARAGFAVTVYGGERTPVAAQSARSSHPRFVRAGAPGRPARPARPMPPTPALDQPQTVAAFLAAATGPPPLNTGVLAPGVHFRPRETDAGDPPPAPAPITFRPLAAYDATAHGEDGLAALLALAG